MSLQNTTNFHAPGPILSLKLEAGSVVKYLNTEVFKYYLSTAVFKAVFKY